MVKAFLIYVRPLLETFSQVWNPIRKDDIKKLEGVQRRFTKNVFIKCGIPHQEYEDRLKFFGLPSLEQRRLFLDLALTHRLFHSPYDVINHLVPKLPCARELRNTHHIKGELRPTRVRKEFFTNRVVQPWNSLESKQANLMPRTFKEFLKRSI